MPRSGVKISPGVQREKRKMITSMIADVICYAFEEYVGRWQAKKDEKERKGLAVTVSLNENFDTETGYRYADLVIYGYANYVSVFTRTRADVAPLDKDGEVCGPYEKTETEWKLECHHDSCWRSAISDFFFEHIERATVFNGSPFSNGFMKPYVAVSKRELQEAGVPTLY